MTTINYNATNAQDIDLIYRNFIAALGRQSWSQTRAIERRIQDAGPVWTNGDNGESEPWDWIHGEYTALYLMPRYGYVVYHRTGAGGSEAIKTEDGGFVGGSALYAVNPYAVAALTDHTIDPRYEDLDEFLQFAAVELAHSRN